MDTPLIFGEDGLLYAGDAPRAGKYVVTAHGIINNGSKEDKCAERSSKSSIMDRLKAAKSEP